MKLSSLKPAWQQFRLSSSMQYTDQNEILLILEQAEGMVMNRTGKILVHAIVFVVITFCIQGG